MGGVRAVLARWRADRGLLALLVLVIGATAGLAGAVPRLLDELQRASLAAELADTRTDQLGVAATQIERFRIGSSDVGAQRLALGATTASAEIGPQLAGVLADPVPVVDSVRYDLSRLPGQPVDPLSRKLTVRMQGDLEPAARLVEGRWPDGVVETTELATGQPPDDSVPGTVSHRVHEFVATATTAEQLEMVIGDRRVGRPDETGPVSSRVVPYPHEVVVFVLSGIVELSDVTEPVWFGDARLHRPTRFDTNSSTTIFAYGMVPARVMTELPGAGVGQVAGVGWRWQLRADALLQADADTVRAEALVLRTAAPLTIDQPRWTTGLDRVLAREAARRATAAEVLGLGAVSVVVVAAALLSVIAGLLLSRRRDTLALVRGRGASALQLLGAAATEAAGVALLGASVAWGLLVWTLPGRGGGLVVLAVVGLAVVVLVGSVRGDLRRPLGVLLAERRRGPSARPTRAVRDGLLVLVAIVGVAALRRRGIEVDGNADVLVVATPVLVSLAAAVVIARVLPLPLRAVEVAARRGRALVLPLGLARAARRATGGAVVVLVVLGVAVSALAGTVHATLVAGQSRAAQERVGADVRVDAPPLATLAGDWEPPSPEDVVAELSVVDGTIVTDLGAQSVDVLLVDAAAVAALGSDGGTVPDLAWDGVGAAPLVVSAVMRSVGSLEIGDSASVLIGIDRIAARVVSVDPRVLGLDAAETGAFVVLDRAAGLAATGTQPGSTSRLVLTDDPAAVARSAREADADVEVRVRTEVLAALADAPLARGVRVGFLVAALAAAVATFLALVLAMVAAAPDRRREAGVLSALGTPRRDVLGALLAEVLPVVAIASVAGVLLCVGVARVLGPRLDLAPFTGTVDATTLGGPGLVLGAALVGMSVAVTTVAALGTLGRVDPARILREADA